MDTTRDITAAFYAVETDDGELGTLLEFNSSDLAYREFERQIGRGSTRYCNLSKIADGIENLLLTYEPDRSAFPVVVRSSRVSAGKLSGSEPPG